MKDTDTFVRRMIWRKTPCLGAALVLSLVAIACSDTDDSSNKAEYPNYTRAVSDEERTACEQHAQAECEAMDRCSAYAMGAYYGTMADCVTSNTRYCVEDFSLADTSLTAAWLDGCTATLPTAPCTSFFAAPATGQGCEKPAGKRAAGEPCTESFQCASSKCDPFGSDEIGCGRCEDRPKTLNEGEACELLEGPQCVDGLACLETCRRYISIGEACTEGDYCAGFVSCWNGVCHEPGGEGAACEEDGHCRTFYKCVGGVCVGAPPATSTVGGPCPTNGMCTDGLTCLVDQGGGVCLHPALEGEACQTTAWSDNCEFGLWCNAGVCESLTPPACH